MSAITTHVLDTMRGRPAEGVPVALDFQVGAEQWERLAAAITDRDGRVRNLLAPEHLLRPGVYRLSFDFKLFEGFYPFVQIAFRLDNPAEHYHVPLLISPYGYSTYRGS